MITEILQTFIQHFQCRRPQPCVFIRSLVQSLIFAHTELPDQQAAPEVILQDLADYVSPNSPLLDPEIVQIETPHDDRFQIAERLATFVDMVRHPYYDLLRALNMNRCRVRRMLCHTITDWDSLQLDLEDLDAELRRFTHEEPLPNQRAFAGGRASRDDASDGAGRGSTPWAYHLASWAGQLKLRQMLWVVQLGAELGVYQPRELEGAYWYLSYLASTRTQLLLRMQAFYFGREDAELATSISAAANLRPTASNGGVLQHQVLEATATQYLAEAVAALYAALMELKLIEALPANAYSSDDLRHRLRLRPFLELYSPAVPPPEAFPPVVRGNNPEGHNWALRNILAKLDPKTQQARRAWEAVLRSSPAAAQCVGCEHAWRDGVKAVQKSAIAVGIAAATLRKWALEGGKELGMEIEVSVGRGMYHPWWIVPKVVVKEGSKKGRKQYVDKRVIR